MTEPVSSPFGAFTDAATVVAGHDLNGKSAVVTGAASGIGVETARALAMAGAAVTLGVRNRAAGEAAAADINTSTGRNTTTVGPLDLSDLASVRAFAEEWGTAPLHLLINNAGVMALQELTLTSDGWELQFATNHLGHFALALGLHDALTAAGDARIVSLSSRGHLRSPVVFEDINFSSRAYDPWLGYGQSKTANVLFAVEVTRRWAGDGITANAVHPGAIAETNLSRHMNREELGSLRASGTFRFKTIGQGAATSVLVATSPQLEGIGGRYFEDCNQAPVLTGDPTDRTGPGSYRPLEGGGVADYALDPENARRLWELSLAATAG